MFRTTMTIGSVVAMAAVGVLGAAPGASAHGVQHVDGFRLAGTMDAPDSAWFGHNALWKAPSGERSAKVAALVAAYQLQAAQAKSAGQAAEAAFEAWQVQAGEARAAAADLANVEDGASDGASLMTAYEEQKGEAQEAWSAAKDAREAWLVQVGEARAALKAVWAQWFAERRAAREAKARDKARESSLKSVRVASWASADRSKTESRDGDGRDGDSRDGDRDGWCDHDGDSDGADRDGDWSDHDGDWSDHDGDRDGDDHDGDDHDGDRRS